jgi:hypothetical protein
MSNSYVYLVQSNAQEGRDDEFNQWYDSVHLPEVLAIEGFESARRFRRSALLDRPDAPAAAFEYFAIYELSGDPVQAVKGLGQAVKAGEIQMSDAMAPGTTSILLEQVEN